MTKDCSYITMRVCPVCGKEFVYKPYWTYRLKIKGAIVAYCSYTCYRKIQTTKSYETVPRSHKCIHDAYTREDDARLRSKTKKRQIQQRKDTTL